MKMKSAKMMEKLATVFSEWIMRLSSNRSDTQFLQ